MNSDTEARIDLLNREKFASDIAMGIIQFVEKQTDGFVIGLTGRWGSGKSTLMGFIRKELEKQSADKDVKTIYIDFNPWFFSENAFISKAFLKEFSDKTKTTKSRAKRFSKLIAPGFRFLKYIGVWKKVAGDLGNDIGELVAKYLENETNTQYKKIIDAALVKDDIKVFVFIDDLDRLHPKQIFEVLQLIKLTGNFKNTFFLLAFDREVVELAIETQFKNYGKNYLEKIIQADFKIPEPLDEVIEKVFFYHLKRIIESINNQKQLNNEAIFIYEESKVFSVWNWHGLKGYFMTLRDIYRYFNSLELRLPSIINEIDLVDFLLIEAIRLFDFNIYEQTYLKYSSALSFQITDSADIPTLLEEKMKNEITKKLILFLFPKQKYFHVSINEKRLNDTNHFYKYFTFAISSKDISENDFKAVMELQNDRQARLKALLKSGRMENLLRRINDNKLIKTYSQLDFNLIKDLYQFISAIAFDHEEHLDDIGDSITHLLSMYQKSPAFNYRKFYDLLSSNSNNIDYGALYFYHWIILETENKNTHFSHNAPEFRNSFMKEYSVLKIEYTAFLKQWASYFLTNPILHQLSYFTMLFIFDYAREYPEEYSLKVKELASNKENILFFLKNILHIDSNRNEAFQFDVLKYNLYLPADASSFFNKTLLQIKDEEQSPNHLQWKKFYLSIEK